MKFFSVIIEKIKDASFFIKNFGISIGLIIMMGGSFIVITNILMYGVLTKQLEKNGIETLNTLINKIENAIIMQNELELFYILDNAIKNKKEITYLLLLDKDKNIKIILPEIKVTKKFLNANIYNEMKESIKILNTEKGKIRDIAIPIMSGELGFLRCGLSEKEINKLIIQNTKISILIFFILSLLWGILSIYLIRFIYMPIKNLKKAVDEMSKGNYKIILKPWAKDEIGQLTLAFNKMAVSLQNSLETIKNKEKLRQDLIKKIILTQEEERIRIARELHDSIGQIITSLKINLKTLELNSKNKKNLKQINYLYFLINKLLKETYLIIYELRPRDLSNLGIIHTIKNYIDEYKDKFSFKINFKTNVEKKLKLKFPVEINAYRIIQEALSNIQRHSKAKNVDIEFLKEKNKLLLNIQDDGIGFNINNIYKNKKKPLGIIGMQERARILNGEFKIMSELNKGTKICIQIPLKKLKSL